MSISLSDDTALDGALDELAFAVENVPLYGKALGKAGVDVDDVLTEQDFARLPTTNKADFRRNFPVGVLAKGRTLGDPMAYRSQSSGTTAERLVTVAERFVLAQRMFTTLGVWPEARDSIIGSRRIVRFAPPNCSDVECSTPLSTIGDRTLPDGTLVLSVAHDVLATPDTMVKKAIAEWAAYEPGYHYSDPTHLAFLVRRARALGLEIPPCPNLVLTYTYPTQVARRQLREAMPDARMLRLYSMSEFGWIATECPAGELHLNTGSFYVEVLPPDGELVLTSIGDRLSPHIRYRTGDLVRPIEGACPCGHAFPRVAFEGRTGGSARRADTNLLTARALDELVGPCPGIDVYQLGQIAETELELLVVPNAAYEPRALEDIAAAVAEKLGASVRPRAVDYISAERSGKFASMTSIVLPET